MYTGGTPMENIKSHAMWQGKLRDLQTAIDGYEETLSTLILWEAAFGLASLLAAQQSYTNIAITAGLLAAINFLVILTLKILIQWKEWLRSRLYRAGPG